VVGRFANRPTQVAGGNFLAPHRVAAAAGERGGIHRGSSDRTPYNVTLSDNPRDLYVLWEEYEFGINGRKASKRFSVRERGQVKYKYHRQKVVWDKIAHLIRQGHTYLTAIDEIHRVYGENSTVTQIINLMRQDRARGGHPELR
jgi:hypothetical protein